MGVSGNGGGIIGLSSCVGCAVYIALLRFGVEGDGEVGVGCGGGFGGEGDGEGGLRCGGGFGLLRVRCLVSLLLSPPIGPSSLFGCDTELSVETKCELFWEW